MNHLAFHVPAEQFDAYRQKLGDLGVVPSPDPMSLAAFQKSEVIKWGEAVRKSGAQVN